RCEVRADVDQVVGDHSESDPTLDAGRTLVAATVQSVAPLENADASLTSGAPLLCCLEPAGLLPFLALFALGRMAGDRHAFDAQFLRRSFVSCREEPRIGGHDARCAPQLALMLLNGGHQQVRIARALVENFVAGDD